ncbi:cell wall-binding repeat-containing protein [Parafrigoribacterium humi]|uniref:cell wall-binding repeat-containing protein n=1 Tax=Parafrigoribacterium humi TaxID=3144664 RepID=UPI0032F005DB
MSIIARRRTAIGRGWVGRISATLAAAAMVGLALVAVQPAQPAHALDGSQFNAGNIIDDAKFYDANAMTQAQIQSFLEAQEPGACTNGYCLKNYRETTPSRAAVISTSTGNTRCGPYTGGTNDTAAAIIYKVQKACGISAKVILVTLQKEQGLVTKLGPSDPAMKRAMGYACPDTSPCAVNSLGFGNQIYQGALQLNTYKAARFGKQPGLWNILYNPSPACGTKTVAVGNYATAALYNYTPYTPNAGALANLTGTAPCGSYGNRNFWVYYSNWFGPPNGDPTGALQSVTASNNTVTVTGWAVDPDVPTWAVDVRVRGAGWSYTLRGSQTSGSSPESEQGIAGSGTQHGFNATLPASVGAQQVCVDALNHGPGSIVTLGCSTVTVPSAYVVSERLSDADRYGTAVKISQKFAPGVAVAYVASGENFPDALSVVPAAGRQGVPLLLVTENSVPAAVKAELVRLKPAKIVVVGGTARIGPAVAADLATIAPTTRIDGVDRYQTSLNVGNLLGDAKSGRAYIATGANFPDALSAAAAAARQNAPLVLADGTAGAVPASLAAALARWGVTEVTLIGGPEALSSAFEASLKALPGGITVTRISGTDRYGTSSAINASVFPAAAAGYVATGNTYADGLTGGALAGRSGMPLYLAPSTCVPSAVLSQFASAHTKSVTLLGGTQALGAGVASFTPCS